MEENRQIRMENDLGRDDIRQLVRRIALPSMLAQFVSVLYSIVDRMYIGHIPGMGELALAGVGVCAPVVTMIGSVASLVGVGGAPLMSIKMGEGDVDGARKILSNCFVMLCLFSLILMAVVIPLRRPMLLFFGASAETLPYADEYFLYYMTGTVFALLATGMNSFVTAQGFARKGMMTVLIGAALNIALDPLFIFVFDMGVRGAALATVLSQFVSALWAVGFLCGRRTLLRLEPRWMRVQLPVVGRITALGFSSFIMAITNSAVQSVCNATLQTFGGDLYVGVMTVLNSVREVVMTVVSGLTNAAQPVMSFNYGARKYRRVRDGIRFTTALCIGYTVLVWALLFFFPRVFIAVFNDDPALMEACVPAMHIYFFGFFMMSLQMAGQAVSVALGRSKQAVFFSLLRKAVIVIPLTLLLPRLFGLGVDGVFLAEPISNFIGGAACYVTMLLTIWPELKRRERSEAA